MSVYSDSQQSTSVSPYYALLETVALKFGCGKEANADKLKSLTPLDISKLFNIAMDVPYSADIESLRGWCLQQIRKNQLALYVYDQVLQKFPLHAVTLRRKGQLLKIMGEEEKSRQVLKLASLLQPDNLHLQILKQEQEDSSNSDDQSQQNSESSSSDQQSEEKEKSQCWRIRIKSIDKPLSQAKTNKSVIFKSMLLQQNDTLSQIKMIGKRTSILKTRSQQNTSIIQLAPNSQIKSAFDIGKIKSIDGKMSCNSIQPIKQIVFAYNNQNLKPHSSNEVSLRRKSSMMMSKFSTNKQFPKQNNS